jgi:hypothetical protein
MKLKTIYFTPLMVVLLAACIDQTPFAVEFDDKTLVYKDDCKQDQCAEVNLVFLQSIGNEMVSEKINSSINEFIVSSLNYAVDDSIVSSSVEAAAKNFISAYKKDKTEFPEISPYFAEINVTNIHRSDKLICMEMKKYLYTGGAHGYESVWYLNIDPRTGEELSTSDLVNNLLGFTQHAERVFRKKMNIPEKGSINATGFWFDDDVFYLPETLGFQGTNVLLIYNPYEIASYADGAIEIVIPIEDIESYLKIK